VGIVRNLKSLNSEMVIKQNPNFVFNLVIHANKEDPVLVSPSWKYTQSLLLILIKRKKCICDQQFEK